MSEFFQSEIVREELEQINELQQEIYGKIMNITNLSNEDKVEHIEKLKVLLDKQRVMYTRLALSDDPEAKKLKKQLEDSQCLQLKPLAGYFTKNVCATY